MNEKMAEEKYTYNRIIIVGNGFDKAWGLKTSYNDFILHLLKKCCLKAFDSAFNSVLLKIEYYNYYSNKEDIKASIKNAETLDVFFRIVDDASMKIEKKSELLKKIISLQYQENWVDIESLYFNLLLEKLDKLKKLTVLQRNYDDVISLNNEFAEIQKELLEYLMLIDSNFKTSFENNIMHDLIDELVNKDNRSKINSIHKCDSLDDPNELLFLNFNYTNTLRKTLNATRYIDKKIINIHGNVNDLRNPIIFGYGDDMHSRYKEIEDEDVDELLKNIKSFYYTNTYDYQEFIDFVLKGNYEVYIVGHSCGLSDRTLLKTIFDDDKCILIKIYTHNGQKEHFQKTIAVSRHCENKAKIRHKIVPFDEFADIPQLNKA